MEILSDYLVVVVTGICFAVGYIIKNSLSFISNKYIPLIMATLGVGLNAWVNAGLFTPEILLGGLASGLAATGIFEIVKKNIKKEV